MTCSDIIPSEVQVFIKFPSFVLRFFHEYHYIKKVPHARVMVQ